MKKSIKKRGQKFFRNFSRASIRASEGGKDHIKENFIGRLSHVANVKLLILEWSLLVFALIMLAITQSFWFANTYSEETFTEGGTYTEATIGKVNSLNPLFATTSSEKTLSKLMFATLSSVDFSGHPGAGLAEYIHSSEDGKVWSIKLRENLRWSDGEPLTNEDVLFTLSLIQNAAVSSVYDSNLSNVGISESESGEIIFTLPTAYADFVSALAIPVVPKHILADVNPKNLIEADFSNKPVTSGAFMLNAVQATSSSSDEMIIYLSRNPHYYKGETFLSSFAVHVYPNKEKIISALNSNAVSATAELSGVAFSEINSNFVAHKDSAINSGAYLFFNMSSASMRNKNLRAAIRQGIDLDTIRLIPTNHSALDFPLIQNQITLSSYPALPAYDPEAARATVSNELGENLMTLKLATVNSGYLPIVSDAIAEDLRNLGFNVDVSVYEENQDFIKNVISERNYDILVYEIELGADPDLLPYYHSSQANSAGLNLSNYKNSLVDALILSARETVDKDLRAKRYEAFLEYWAEDIPAIGLYRSILTYYYNKNVRAYGDNLTLTTALDRFSDITSWSSVKTTKNRTP